MLFNVGPGSVAFYLFPGHEYVNTAPGLKHRTKCTKVEF